MGYLFMYMGLNKLIHFIASLFNGNYLGVYNVRNRSKY